jgi:2'-5' RNA ligase
VKPSIVVIAELTGTIADRIHAVQEQFDPRMAAELPPHITLIGSSGMGPISVRTPPDALRDALLPAAQTIAPMTLTFDAPLRFMQSNVVVLPTDPNSPVRALHEALADGIRRAGIITERARFTFTPHCTLSFYRELPQSELRELLSLRFTDAAEVGAVQAYRATAPVGTEQIFTLRLLGR